jgi:hypothetical protein
VGNVVKQIDIEGTEDLLRMVQDFDESMLSKVAFRNFGIESGASPLACSVVGVATFFIDPSLA